MKLSFRFLVAVACLATISLATPATAGGGLPKDCKKAGLKTQKDCDAFHAAQAKPASTPSAVVHSADPAHAATAGSGNPSALDALLKAAGGGVAAAIQATGTK
jgi:hypothetical protein